MFVPHRVVARLPASMQLGIIGGLVRANVATRFGLFKMFVRTLVAVGADPAELERALRRCRDVGPSFVSVFRELAETVATPSDRDATPEELFRATLYGLLADWATFDLEGRRANYALAIPYFERFARAHDPPIERVRIPFRRTGISGYFVAPEGARAAVLLVPGNDEPKEWMATMAAAATARRLAAIAIDLPGYGENALCGVRLDGNASLRESASGVLTFLSDRGIHRAGVFGVSSGGLVAHLVAGLVPAFTASVGLGGPYDLAWAFDHVPCLQRRRFLMATGLREARTVRAFVRALDVEGVLRSVSGPALVFHGTDDEVVPFSHARAIVDAIGPRAELHAIEGGDHMGNPHLKRVTEVGMDWLAARL